MGVELLRMRYKRFATGIRVRINEPLAGVHISERATVWMSDKVFSKKALKIQGILLIGNQNLTFNDLWVDKNIWLWVEPSYIDVKSVDTGKGSILVLN